MAMAQWQQQQQQQQQLMQQQYMMQQQMMMQQQQQVAWQQYYQMQAWQQQQMQHASMPSLVPVPSLLMPMPSLLKPEPPNAAGVAPRPVAPVQREVSAEELFESPGRASRPDRFVILLRGLPGSGKSRAPAHRLQPRGLPGPFARPSP